MPYKIIPNKDGKTFKVVNRLDGRIYANSTKIPQKLISAIEINKIKNSKKKKKK